MAEREPTPSGSPSTDLYDAAAQSLQVIITSVDNIRRMIVGPSNQTIEGTLANSVARVDRAVNRLAALLREHRCMGQEKTSGEGVAPHQSPTPPARGPEEAGAFPAVMLHGANFGPVERINLGGRSFVQEPTANPKLGMIPGDKEEIADARESLRPILAKLGCISMEEHGEDADGDLYSDVECLRLLVDKRMADGKVAP